MKIILANKFYYRRGGDCVYTIELEQLLKKHGHDVAIFAMDYPENYDTPWKQYFPSEVSFNSIRGVFKTLFRPFGSNEVKQKFNKLLDDFQPDIVHLNNIHTQLSPIIAELAHNRGIKVVWTIHDYKLLCPRYDCLRNGRDICEKCFSGNKLFCLSNRCIKNSIIGSWIGYKEAIKWNRERLEKCTDLFICPSKFMAKKMVAGGFYKNKIVSWFNFIDINKCKRLDYNIRKDYYCFVGRLSHEKGCNTLIKVANQLPYKLKIIGNGPLINSLKAIANNNIEFVGFKQWDEIKKIVGEARFVVTPSEWYEVFGLVNIEAQCLGTPVLGARIGGITELINENINGMTFTSHNEEDLKNKILEMFSFSFNYVDIAQKACKEYNAETYYEKLIKGYTITY
ncbi:glycosyltransferase [Prevotella sp.]|uniref:glycosyltransferase n=1 Tax=Prevotella sp. TaxID=59823 RepID=UPI003AB28B8C